MLDKIFNYFSYYQWWKNLDKFILSLIITLFLIGLFFSLVSTSLIASDKLNTNSYFFFFKHLVFVFIGLLIIFVFSYINEKTLYKISIYLFLISFILLLLVPIVGVQVKGSTRWIDLLFLPRLQPVELMKPFFIIMLALIISHEKLSNFVTKFIISFILTSSIVLLLVLQPDLGQTLLIVLNWSILIFVSGINLFILISISTFCVIILLYITFYVPKFEYIKNRLLSFFDSETGTHNFQSDKALESISSVLPSIVILSPVQMV